MTYNEHFIVGARNSPLSMIQTQNTLRSVEEELPGISFEIRSFLSAGDIDQKTTLDKSPDNFFTDMLDSALSSGEIDCAIHSAKDLPPQLSTGLASFWFPWRADPRDVVVLPEGKSFEDIPFNPRVGISSERREAWANATFDTWQNKNIRGTIERRLEQLDSGDFDLLLMAGAALIRLGLEERISRWIPLEELAPPEGQGYIAITYRSNDERFRPLRDFYQNYPHSEHG